MTITPKCDKALILKALALLRAEVVGLNEQITALQSDGRKLKATINAMKCCANCRHAHYDGMDYECYADIHGITGDCCPPDLELWELRAKGDKKP